MSPSGLYVEPAIYSDEGFLTSLPSVKAMLIWYRSTGMQLAFTGFRLLC